MSQFADLEFKCFLFSRDLWVLWQEVSWSCRHEVPGNLFLFMKQSELVHSLEWPAVDRRLGLWLVWLSCYADFTRTSFWQMLMCVSQSCSLQYTMHSLFLFSCWVGLEGGRNTDFGFGEMGALHSLSYYFEQGIYRC